MDTAPILEPAEHVLDLAPLAIKNAVMFDRLLAVGLRRDAGRDAAFGERSAKPVGVIALSPSNCLADGRASNIRAAPL
jgi:hypothetical protein